ncbi:MAG: nucleotidyltransferase domain-containing protein [Magnetococcus sp. YQC-9]
MRLITEQELLVMIGRIAEVIQPEKIWLFGSMVRGEATEGSDIDLLVVEQEGFEQRSRWRELEKIRDLLVDFPMSKDVLLYSMQEMDCWQGSGQHIIAHVVNEGRLLYERI